MCKPQRTPRRILQKLARCSTVCVLIGLLSAGGVALSTASPSTPSAPSPTVAPSLAPKPTPTPTPTAAPVVTPTPTAKPTPTLAPAPTAYDYAAAVPTSDPVKDSWFADAAFVGDSRTEGLVLYTTLKPGASFAYRGLTVQSARTDAILSVNGKKRTAMDALKQGSYAKVYLSLGVNELGWYNNDRFYKNYAQLVDLVLKAQPKAQVYLQTLIPVTAKKSGSSYINNPQILVYNKLIHQLAEEKKVYVVDTWAACADSNGVLPAKGSVDGVHLTKAYYKLWLDYLKTHTIAP